MNPRTAEILFKNKLVDDIVADIQKEKARVYNKPDFYDKRQDFYTLLSKIQLFIRVKYQKNMSKDKFFRSEKDKS